MNTATVTTVKLKGKHIEIHLNGGGYGTFGDNLKSGLFKSPVQNKVEQGNRSSGKASGGSRINLRFDRDVEPEDIDLEVISGYLEPVMDTRALAVDIARENIPDEYAEAAENGEVLEGMPKNVVFAIKGEPAQKKVNLDVSPPAEIWQFDLENMQTMIVTFQEGKVAKIDVF